jgi:hypothetical protein
MFSHNMTLTSSRVKHVETDTWTSDCWLSTAVLLRIQVFLNRSVNGNSSWLPNDRASYLKAWPVPQDHVPADKTVPPFSRYTQAAQRRSAFLTGNWPMERTHRLQAIRSHRPSSSVLLDLQVYQRSPVLKRTTVINSGRPRARRCTYNMS